MDMFTQLGKQRACDGWPFTPSAKSLILGKVLCL